MIERLTLTSVLASALLKAFSKALRDIEMSDISIREKREFERQFRSLPEHQCLITERIGDFFSMNYRIIRICHIETEWLHNEHFDDMTDCFKKYFLEG